MAVMRLVVGFPMVAAIAKMNYYSRRRLPPVLRNHDAVKLITSCSAAHNVHNTFDRRMDDPTARIKFRFSVHELVLLCTKLRLPELIITVWNDKVEAIEAMTITCRRLVETCRLLTIANEFGRSMEDCSRIIHTIVNQLHRSWSRTMYCTSTNI
ncbi:hypothetical protein H257_12942 [Aphanomyces astaci]|uniref:DDE Tnp4 domain-containing protein n=1 Tax=Aphanomyces astaci TaxID=112090 RepID=W4FWD3_APHAT|nr:hypothetical protein H257_12942 [Aphanomyces astaci]ETV71797.1 hypothetical protein H257_12942 [Aphanomyces astaci]|eukprot:XP_009838646.1 hypothetical protein H257_12942 [Aphanomyces astaci]